MSDLIDTTEMYLRTIFELEEEGVVPLRARIAERLGQSGPTVSQTVARMERAGLLAISVGRQLELTDQGRAKATEVMRKHRLAERLLLDVIGLEWPYVHEEACRWEHVMSERVERKIIQLLDHPTESPYGNPIPGLAELGESVGGGSFWSEGLHRLDEVAVPEERVVTVRRIGEPAQQDSALLATLQVAGLVPGRQVWVCGTSDAVQVWGAEGASEGRVSLSRLVAEHVFVSFGDL